MSTCKTSSKAIRPHFNLLGMIAVISALWMAPNQEALAEDFSGASMWGDSIERRTAINKGCTSYYFCAQVSIIKLSLTNVQYPTQGMNYDIAGESTFETLMDISQGDSDFIADQIAKGTARDKDGSIKITLPMIDYGYTGTFNEILITVNTPDGEVDTATRDLYDGDYTAFTGSVTIEKYDTFTLKGSYSGTLNQYDPIYPDGKVPYYGPLPSNRVQQYKLGRSGNISGEFNIISAWREDERIVETMDMRGGMGGSLLSEIDRLAAAFNIDTNTDGLKDGEQSQVANAPQCDCSCNYIDSAPAQCQSMCSASFTSCKGQRLAPKQSPSAFPTSIPEAPIEDTSNLSQAQRDIKEVLDGSVVEAPENLRQKYIAVVAKKHPGPAMAELRAQMLAAFDEMPDDKLKMMMFLGMGGKP